jgi:hypothetical protein
MHRPRRLPPNDNITRVFGTFGATLTHEQQMSLIASDRGYREEVVYLLYLFFCPSLLF